MKKKMIYYVALFSSLLLLFTACAPIPTRNPIADGQPSSLPTASLTPTGDLTATNNWAQFQVTLDALKTQVAQAKGTTTQILTPAQTMIATPSATPITPRPVITATPHPQAISLQNYWKMQEVERLGKGYVYAVAWSPDGKVIAVAGGLGIDLYDAKTLGMLRKIQVYGSELAFSPNGARMAVASRNSIQLFDPSTGRPLLQLASKIKHPTAILFSSDGSYLVLRGESSCSKGDYSFEVWDLNHATSLYAWQNQPIDRVAISPDGNLLATAGWDGTVRLWNLDDGKSLCVFNMHGSATSVAFSPDGRYLAAGSSDGTVYVWGVSGK